MRVNPSQLPNYLPTPDPRSYDAVVVLGLTWLDRNDQACLRRIVPPPVATRLVHMKAKGIVADVDDVDDVDNVDDVDLVVTP